MVSEIRKNITSFYKEKISFYISFLAGLILITSIPYSAGAAHNWYIPLLDGYYNINFFYLAEILLFGSAFFIYGFKLKNKIEAWIFLAILFVILTRVISIFFAAKFEKIQIVSLVRYVEVFLCIYVLSNLLSVKRNRNSFLAGLAIGVLLESVIGFLKFVLTAGALRGIFMCIHSFQIEIFFILAFMVFANTKNKYALISAISILIVGIISTQTRSALLEFGLGLILVMVYAYKKNYFKKVLPIVIFSIVISTGFSFAFKSIAKGTVQRVEEAMEGGGTIAYRFYLWDKGLGAFFSSPITGIGTGGFGKQLATLPQVFNVPMEGERRIHPISPHSSVILVLSETGLVGLAAYIFWIIAIIRLTIAVFKNKTFDSYAVACALMMIIFIACDTWSINSFYPNMSYIAAYMLGFLRENTGNENQQ